MPLNGPGLTAKRIFLFWLPLAATWLMMSLEGPFLSAVIARLAAPKTNLAAYGVAFSVALLVEAPIIMVMSAATALVRGRQSYLTMKRFVYILNAIITLIMLLIVFRPIFDLLALKVIDLAPEVADITWVACVLLIPWPAAIGYRRFYQGILIRHEKTSYVAYGTVVRLGSMALMALLLALFSTCPGAVIGGASLAFGVICEAVASRIMASGVIRFRLTDKEEGSSSSLTYRRITKFYYPLALTAVLALGVRPVLTFFMGQSYMALESLAVFPVVHSLVFIFVCLGISYQEVVIALVGDDHANYLPLKRFAIYLAIFATSGLGLIAFTPLSGVWFKQVAGLTPVLADFSVLPVQILSIVPAFWVWVCFQRAILVSAGRTAPITQGTALQVIIITIICFLTIHFLNVVGVVASSIALLCGGIVGCLYLVPWFVLVRRETGSYPLSASCP